MPNGLTCKIHNKIPQNFQGCYLGEDEILFKIFKQRPSKLKKGYSQDLVKQTVVFITKILKLSYTAIVDFIINNLDLSLL